MLYNSKPLLTTWGYQQDVGKWDVEFSIDFISRSVEEQKNSCKEIILKTLDAFKTLARVNRFAIFPSPELKPKLDVLFIKWEQKEDYEDYIKRFIKTLLTYPVEIYEIEILVDLNVFVYIEKSPNIPVRSWIRCIEPSTQMGRFSIYNWIEEEAGMIFAIEHTLFYPFSYQGEDNDELFKLNQPLLEEALKNWENQFNAEIEADGLPGIYKYGFLPYSEWNK